LVVIGRNSFSADARLDALVLPALVLPDVRRRTARLEREPDHAQRGAWATVGGRQAEQVREVHAGLRWRRQARPHMVLVVGNESQPDRISST
jgi:hypothetical protein